jgi:5'-nucleotidase
MRTKSLLYSVSIVLVLALLLALPLPAFAAGKPPTVDVQVLALNDFHGALNPSKGIGGAAFLATYVKNLSAENPNTVRVSAGDMIGASPIESALFHDQPTIQAFNLMGFDFSAVGNHEFDEGVAELLRMQNGGCHPTDGCYTGVPPFTGAAFKYLAANVIRLDTGETLFPAYMVKQYGKVKVAFIGISLESTPTIVVPSGVAGLEFQPEVATINHYVKYLKDSQGIKAFVVLLHDGGGAAANANACNQADPFFTNVVMKVDPEVDALITGHSHNTYNCQITVKKNYGPMLVTSAGNNGKFLTDIDLTINGTNGQVVARSANNVSIVDSAVTPDAAVAALLAQYATISAPIANAVIGSITADITRSPSAAGESALGDVIADAQLEASAPANAGAAVVAMTNPGGIRTDLLYASSPAGEGDGNVTYGEAFAVQPFSNSLVTMTLTGAQLKAVLEQQATTNRVLQISASLTYSWSTSAAAGSKVSVMKINSVAVDPAASYRVTVNNFLAAGGDGFTTLTAGTNLLTGEIDLDAFIAYIKAHSPVAPGPQNRITLVP